MTLDDLFKFDAIITPTAPCDNTYASYPFFSYYKKIPVIAPDLPFLKEEIRRANIEGVILQRINNCDLHGCDNMLFTHELKELEIPVLNFDREFYQADTTRLQTRIEAFLEMI